MCGIPDRYEDVPGVGPVNVSAHARERAAAQRISRRAFEAALLTGARTPDGPRSAHHEHAGVRVVVVRPHPFKGVHVAVTTFWVSAAARARRRS